MAKKKLSKKQILKKHKELQNKAKKYLSDAKNKLKAVEKKVNAYIKKHPDKAAMMAAGVGDEIGDAVTAALRRKRR